MFSCLHTHVEKIKGCISVNVLAILAPDVAGCYWRMLISLLYLMLGGLLATKQMFGSSQKGHKVKLRSREMIRERGLFTFL